MPEGHKISPVKKMRWGATVRSSLIGEIIGAEEASDNFYQTEQGTRALCASLDTDFPSASRPETQIFTSEIAITDVKTGFLEMRGG
jgi:hypothetical protein